MYSVIFVFLSAFHVIPLGECGSPCGVIWTSLLRKDVSLSHKLSPAPELVPHKSKNMSFFERRTEIGHIQCSGTELKPLCPSALLMGTCTTKQSLKLSSENILRNSTFSHLLFPVSIPSASSPWQGLQITLGNQSQNLQHFLVPDANYSRILKAIPQTPIDPEGGFMWSPYVILKAWTSWNSAHCQLRPGLLNRGRLHVPWGVRGWNVGF